MLYLVVDGLLGYIIAIIGTIQFEVVDWVFSLRATSVTTLIRSENVIEKFRYYYYGYNLLLVAESLAGWLV